MIVKGKIIFDPDNITRKHKDQSSWKLMALLMIPGDICDYYKWFIQKRYNIELNKPLRGAHISFINDSIDDMAKNLGVTQKEALINWNNVKSKWHKKTIEIEVDTDVRTDGKHWWLQIPENARKDLHAIRAELGLKRPYFGLHLTCGHANEKNIDHSMYIHNLIVKYGGEYN